MHRAVALILLFLGTVSLHASEPLAAGPQEIRPVLLGSPMPDANLQTLAGNAITLSTAVAGKPAILVFYRGGWCPFCNLQLSELRLIQKDVEALGYRLIAISPDLPAELNKTLTKDALEYTLLSDSKAEALRAFGIGYRLDDATFEKYRSQHNIDLERSSGESHHGLPVPSVFIVDGEGVLQFSYVHPDYRIRVPGDVVLAAAKAIAKRTHYVKPEMR